MIIIWNWELVKVKVEGKMISEAQFGSDAEGNIRYRYSLKRLWDENLPKATLIMLNPSIANELKNDASINRALNYLIDEGYGSLEVVNLFAHIETDSSKLEETDAYVGLNNDSAIIKAIEDASKIIVSWGSDKNFRTRKRTVCGILNEKVLHYFDDGSGRTIPVHMSRLKNGFTLREYTPRF